MVTLYYITLGLESRVYYESGHIVLCHYPIVLHGHITLCYNPLHYMVTLHYITWSHYITLHGDITLRYNTLHYITW